ncbi:hypothetical protein BDV33DRAFT_196280 [Aspergillus novoparasiticus]|uniref:Caspase domain-containing protein n=1 Tax=Aspergillus novoparasiticus TaxID=986946 RepID=A0A5N6E9F8_9EURO|nr:hypothetical protein BDV33DRAFT_196280 [Aspergillus novoparasiticus]
MADALNDIREKIGKLIKYDTPTSLFIVMYEGHSSRTDKDLTLYGSRRYTPAIPWLTRIRHADKLLILDSCFSTAAAIEGCNNEYLAASSSESQASGCVERSFTRRFLDLLASIDCPEITVAQIHAKLVTQANKPESQQEYTPVHFTSTERPSSTLRPLDKGPSEVAGLRRTGELADGKVLISTLLEGKPSIPKIEEWKKWLTSSIPDAVADIKIEAVFESTSSICLVSMPVAVWDMLKRIDAYGASIILESRAGNVQLPTREK